DMEDIKPATEDIENQLIKSSIKATSACDVVILSDYAKGTLTDRVLKEVITAAKSKGIPVVVDPKSANFARYSGATVLKPNLKELSAAYGTEVKEDTEVLGAAMNLLESGNFDNLVITRSEHIYTCILKHARYSMLLGLETPVRQSSHLVLQAALTLLIRCISQTWRQVLLSQNRAPQP
ncbi:MAG: PfkB family carbohydrate kinase, partial [Rhodospirillales bacterium]